jgi:hypothetical protein
MQKPLNNDHMWGELHEALKKMDIPPDRFNDLNWLLRNMGIKNRNHPDFYRAEYIVRVLKRDVVQTINKLNQLTK